MSITVSSSEYAREFWDKSMRNKPCAYGKDLGYDLKIVFF